MSSWHIIAYDVKDPRRLSRLHRRIKKDALALQKSVYAVDKSSTELDSLIEDILNLVDTRLDDVRLYPIHSLKEVWALGQQPAATEGLLVPQRQRRKKAKKGLFTEIKLKWLRSRSD